MSNDQIQAAFEAQSIAMLQAAVNAADGRPEVTDIYVCLSRIAEMYTAYVVYGFASHAPVRAHQLDEVVAQPVGSLTSAWQDNLLDPIRDAYMSLIDVYEEVGAEKPSRIVIHYDVPGESMDSTFSYNTLHADSLSANDAFDVWFANAVATGDFSADATTVAG